MNIKYLFLTIIIIFTSILFFTDIKESGNITIKELTKHKKEQKSIYIDKKEEEIQLKRLKTLEEFKYILNSKEDNNTINKFLEKRFIDKKDLKKFEKKAFRKQVDRIKRNKHFQELLKSPIS